MLLPHTSSLNTVYATCLTLSVWLFSLATPLYADTRTELPLGTVLDSQGNPIAIPRNQQSALEIPSLKPAKQNRTKRHKPTTKNSRSQYKKKPLSRKQQLASRANVANDPGCRWLNTRMDQLEKNLSYKGNSNANSYHQKELTIRESEWKCMKCGAEGPNLLDHDRCQYRR